MTKLDEKALEKARKAQSDSLRDAGLFDTTIGESPVSAFRASLKTAITAYLSAIEAQGYTVGKGWRDISEAPKGRKLTVGYFNALGNWRQVMGRYYEPNTLPWSEEQEAEEGEGFAPEGWYEESETHETILRLECEPTHFKPLDPPPPQRKDTV